MVRVAIISTLPPQKTGESPYTARLIDSLVATGETQVLAITGKEADVIESPDGRIQTYRIWNGRSLKYPFTLLKQIRRLQPDVVHVQFGPYGKVYGGLFGEVMLLFLILLRIAGVRTTVTLHSTWMPQQVTERVGKYGLLSKFAPLAKAFFRIYMKLLDWGTSTIQLSTVKIDSTLRQVFLRTYGYKPEKVLEIPHPCVQLEERTDQKAAEERLGVAGRKAILMFGFIRRGKGFETALRAVEIVRRKKPEILLLVAGRPQGFDSDRYMTELQNLTSELNLTENVRFDTRFIPDDEVPDYFAASTVLLIPYTESVGASGPIHNYAGYGVPILASDVGYRNRDTVGGNLFLFKAGDAEDLAQNLEVILSKPELAQKMSRGQVEYARREGWNVAGERTLSYYKKTLKM